MNAQQAFEDAYALSKKYTEESLLGAGALKGKDGVSVVGGHVDNNNLTLELSDGNKVYAGNIGYDVLETTKDVLDNTEPGKLVDSNVVKEVFTSVSNGKKLIASAITDKGVQTDAEDTFSVMAENIMEITTGTDHEYYDGEYNLVPKVQEQTIDTKEKLMKNNVIVSKIPFHEVSNDTGTTVIIGGIF